MLTTRDQVLITAIDEYQQYIGNWAQGKGFWKYPVTFVDGDLELTKLMPVDHPTIKSTKLMLIVSELGEALEAIRKKDAENELEEIADAFIRLLDYAGTYKLRLAEAVIKKMAVNEGRPYKHGKEF